MKTLVISDLHLTEKFNQKVYDILIELLNKVDRVIINGDFWEKDFVTFDGFVNSDWNKLFSLLKSKQTVYIYGNHDEENLCDERVNLFSAEQGHWKDLVLKTGSKLEIYSKNRLVQTIAVEKDLILKFNHGQGVAPFENKFHELLDTNILFKPLRFLVRLVFDLRILFLNQKHYYLFRKMNITMQKWVENNLNQNEVLVCGHSHLQEASLGERFIDLGCFTKGQYQYMIIVDSNQSPVVSM
jgi:predicted phosphodiesterase